MTGASKNTRLTNNQFLALRSIAREPWNLRRERIQWRFNGEWCQLFQQYGVRAPLESVDGTGGRCGYKDVFEDAWDAATELEAQGLVKEATVRCCPGTPCHANDIHEYRLTPRGAALLKNANAANSLVKSDTQATPATPLPETSHQSWLTRVVSVFSSLRFS